MTIRIVRQFTGDKAADVRELEQRVLQCSTYLNEHTDATVTVMRSMSGNPVRVVAVEVWTSLAACEAGFQKLREDSEWQPRVDELNQINSSRDVTFYREVEP